MTGLTNTGLAIKYMVQEGFSKERGARLDDDTVAKVAIVITDGRSQDQVAEPARVAREAGIQVNVNVTNGDFNRGNSDLRYWRYRSHQAVRARGDLWRSLTNIPCRVRL